MMMMMMMVERIGDKEKEREREKINGEGRVGTRGGSAPSRTFHHYTLLHFSYYSS